MLCFLVVVGLVEKTGVGLAGLPIAVFLRRQPEDSSHTGSP